MNKTVLISGGAGFLGSHLCDFFLEKGFKVISVDNFLTGSEENISHLKLNPNFIFLNLDITKNLEIDNKVDYILHFASPASPIDYLKMPIQTLQVGSIGTQNMLNIAEKNNATILVASTSEVYGDPLQHPQKENYFGNVNPVGPRGVYDEAKRYLEALATAYKNYRGISVRIARIFNTYGPRMRKNDGRAIPTFINQFLKNEPYTIFGDGKQTRSFCYVDDTIEGIYKLLFSNYSKPVNIGNPQELNLIELIKIIDKFGNKRSTIKYLPLTENDPKVRKPDMSLAKNLLDWYPKVSLEDGLLKSIRYFKSKKD